MYSYFMGDQVLPVRWKMAIYEYFFVGDCITKGFIVTWDMNVYLLSNKKKKKMLSPGQQKNKQANKQLAIDSIKSIQYYNIHW